MITFYQFFALMGFAAYPLVIHGGGAEEVRAGRVYMVLVVLGELALLAGLQLAAEAEGSLLFGGGEGLAVLPAAAVGLLLAGFGIKAGLVPLHVWLPLAHPAAPTPASAVLSGAMIKAGLLGWMRFLPPGAAPLPAWGQACLAAGLCTAFYAAAAGLAQRNAKAVLAYSSISQMGLITLGLGGGLLVPDAWPGLLAATLAYALHHGLSKGCLFLGLGVAPAGAGSGWRGWLVRCGLVLPALALAGGPLTSGAVSKAALKEALGGLSSGWPAALGVLLPLASVGTTLLMLRFLYLAWPRPEPVARKVPLPMLAAWAALLAAVAGAAWLLPDATGGTAAMVRSLTWSNLWPLLAGGAAAAGGWRIAARRGPLPALPPGDVLALWHWAWPVTARWLYGFPRRTAHPPREQAAPPWDRSAWVQRTRSAEAAMNDWTWIAASLAVLAGASCLRWFWPP